MDLTEGAGGYLRQVAQNYLPFRDDAIVPVQVARDYALRDGTEIEGLARDAGGGRRVVVEITKASGMSPEEYRALPNFQDLVSVNPHEGFRLAAEQAETSLRILVLGVFPIVVREHYVAICRVRQAIGRAAGVIAAGGCLAITLAVLGGLVAGLPGLAAGYVVAETILAACVAPIVYRAMGATQA